MTKELRCRDLVFDCDGVVTGETEEEVLTQMAEHGQRVPGLSADELNDPNYLDLAKGHIHPQRVQPTRS